MSRRSWGSVTLAASLGRSRYLPAVLDAIVPALGHFVRAVANSRTPAVTPTPDPGATPTPIAAPTP